jgi:adenosine deaminase/adenosine deaminase CECR1
LKNTVYNSIQFSFLSDDEKLKQKKLLDQRFARFEKDTAQSVKDFRRVTAAD